MNWLAALGLGAVFFSWVAITAWVLAPRAERRAALALVLIGLIASFLKIAVFQQVPQWLDINPDSFTYELNARAFALHWDGILVNVESYNLRGLMGLQAVGAHGVEWLPHASLLYGVVIGSSEWLYTAYVGLWYWLIGVTQTTVIWSHALWAAFFPAAAFGIALSIGASKRVALAAAGLGLLDPSAGVNASWLLKDTLAGYLAMAAVWGALSFLRDGGKSRLLVVILTLGALGSVRYVAFIRNTILDPRRSSRSTIWVAGLCARLSRWLPAKIVVCASAAVSVHKTIGYDAQRMVIIANGYDVSRFSPDVQARRHIRAKWGIPDNVPLLGMVARFDPYKDHSNLVEALARLHARGVRFCGVLIGTGVDTANKTLMHQIALSSLTEKVRLLGPLDDIPAVMNALDLHVLSSSAEAFPNVLAEAMACGTPCVSTDVGDAAAILGDTGWIAPSGNPTVLADAIETALRAWAHQERWLVRQQRCRQRVCDEYALEKMVGSYRDIWSEVAASRAS